MRVTVNIRSREPVRPTPESTDNVTPQKVILYEIYVNGVHENSAIGTMQAVAYGVFGENVITVVAIDEAGNRSTAGRTTIFIQG
jgi:hypothetical protein